MPNKIIITEWAFDSYSDLLGRQIIISDKANPNENYQRLRKDALLIKDLGTNKEDPKFTNKKFWERLKGVTNDLFEMK